MIENARIWLPMMKMKNTSCAIPSVRRPRLPSRMSPASAMVCIWVWRCFNCPMVYPVYVVMIPTPRMATTPLCECISEQQPFAQRDDWSCTYGRRPRVESTLGRVRIPSDIVSAIITGRDDESASPRVTKGRRENSTGHTHASLPRRSASVLEPSREGMN